MANIKKDFASPNGPILLLSAKGSTTASIAEANGVKDFSGNGNHGKGNNGVTVEKYGGYDCFGFPNNNSYIYLSDKISTIFTQGSAYTYSVSFIVTSKPTRSNGILIMWSFIMPANQIWLTSDYKINVTANADFSAYTASTAVELDKLYTVTVSANYASGVRHIYVNGVLVSTSTRTAGNITLNVTYMILGNHSGSTGYNLPGYIIDARIYPRALSAAEVKYLYNGFQPNLIMGQTIPSGAILDLSARGLTTAGIAQANGVVDRSGNRNHGQAYNGVTVVTDDEMGDCFSFDGTAVKKITFSNTYPISTNAITLSVIMRHLGRGGGSDGYNAIFGNNMVLCYSPAGSICLQLKNNSSGSAYRIDTVNNETLIDGNIHSLIGIMYIENNICYLQTYVDGALQSPSRTSGSSSQSTLFNGMGNILIGELTASTAYKSNIQLADVRIYPYALTASEVQQLADASLKKIRDINIGSDLIKHIYYGSNLIYTKIDDYEAIPSEVIFELHQINEATQPYPIVYSGKNANFSGITYSNSTPNLGAWKDWIDAHFTPVMLRSNGTVAYELNKDNQNYKKDGTTASDVANINYDGNAMLRIKKFYLSCSTAVVGSGSSAYSVHTVKISDTKKDSSYTCWGFVDANGNEKDYVYYALYNCHKDSNNKLRSMSGVTLNDSRPGNQLLSYNDMVAAAKANGTGWDISNLALENAIGLVLMMIYKSVNPTFINQEYVDLYKQAMSVYQVTGTRNADGGFPYVTATQKQKALWIESFWRSNYDNINQSRAWINGLSSLRTGTGINDFLPYYRKQPPYDDFTTISNWTPMSSTTPHAYMSDAVSHELRTVMFYDNIMFPKDDGVARRGSITAATINRYFGGGEISGSTSTSLQYTDRLLPAQTCGGVMQDQYSSMPHYLGYSLVGTGTNNYQKYGSARLIFFGDPVFSRTQLSTSALGSNSRCVFVSPEGNMFATDWSGKCVKIFNSSGVYVRSFTPLSGKIPYGITGDATYLYVCYWDSANIYKYQYSGTDTPTLVSTWTAPVIYNDGAALYGDYLYVVSQQKQMFKINTSTGAVTSIETSAYAINAIGIDTKNNRIVTVHNGGLGRAEAPNNKAIIKIHDISGNLLTQKTLDGEYTSAINGAQGVVVDKNGYIYLGGAYSIRAQYNQGLLVLNENLEVAYDISYTTCPTFCYSFCYDSYHNRIVWIGSGIGASPYIYAIDI